MASILPFGTLLRSLEPLAGLSERDLRRRDRRPVITALRLEWRTVAIGRGEAGRDRGAHC